MQNTSAAEQLTQLIDSSDRALVVTDTLDVFSSILLEKYAQGVIDGAWISSLGVSSRIGIPDVYNISVRDYAPIISDMKQRLPNFPIVVDADNGGQSYKTTKYTFQKLAALGVGLGIIENKRGAKYNSIDQSATKLHKLEDNEVFAQKVNAALGQSKTMVGVRLENAIVNEDNYEVAMDSCMEEIDYFNQNSRPHFYVIHWKQADPEFIVSFGKAYVHKYGSDAPYLACIPTTYSKNITNQALYEAGYKLLVYGNPMLRTQLQGVKDLIDKVREADNLSLVDKDIPSPKEIFETIGD